MSVVLVFVPRGSKGLVRFEFTDVSWEDHYGGDHQQGGRGGGPQRDQALVEISVSRVLNSGGREREGRLTFVVLLFSLGRFRGDLLEFAVQLMVFDGFLHGALLEDGEEEVALVGKYACPLSLLSV